jgi:lipopolysaccharide transport protein LptA
MDWDSQKSEATYKTKAKLWQDKNVITADRIIINDQEKTLSAYEKVHTIFYNNKPPAGEAQTQTRPTKDSKAQPQSQPQTQKVFGDSNTMGDGPISVDAGIMNYVERDRIVHFEKDVKISTQATKINGQKADFYLKEKSSDFDRLVAQGKVEIQHEQKRGTGNEATFYANEKKLVLEGSPKISEPAMADIVGRVLTLFLADDRILIDGEEDGRAATTLQMKSNIVPPAPDTSSKKKEKKPPDADSKN